MAFRWLFTLLVLSGMVFTTEAASMNCEITPEHPIIGEVKVSSHRLANGHVQFSVTIVPKTSNHYGTSLGRVKITDHEQFSRPLRSLPANQKDGMIECSFSVTPKELANPDLAFRLTSGNAEHFSFATYFIRLSKFLPP